MKIDINFVNVAIDFESLAKAPTEESFMKESINISSEAIMNNLLLLKSFDDIVFNPNEHKTAVIFGLMARTIKLSQSYMNLNCCKQGEGARIILRSVFETIINLRFLMGEESQELFDEYVKYSLITEKKLYTQIQKKIDGKGFEEPIETRMKESIIRAIHLSGYTIDEINVDSKKNKWAKITLRNKLEKALKSDDYDFLFGGEHHSVHGNWEDILENQLHFSSRKDAYELNFIQALSSPQEILTFTQLLCETTLDFIEYVCQHTDISESLKKNFINTFNKSKKIDSLHEACLSKGE